MTRTSHAGDPGSRPTEPTDPTLTIGEQFALDVLHRHGPLRVGDYTIRPRTEPRITGAIRYTVADVLLNHGLVEPLPDGHIGITRQGSAALEEAR